MPREYRVNLECLQALPRSGRRREAIVEFIRRLGSIAHLGGDFQVVDPETFRRFEVTSVAGFAVTWWIDSPVYEVKIVDLRPIVG